MSQLRLATYFNSNIECDFCDIVSGKTSAYIVFEDEPSLAFLDNRPLFPGHCLLIPRMHIPTLVELDSSLVGTIFLNVKILAQAVEMAMQAEGTSLRQIRTVIDQRYGTSGPRTPAPSPSP